MKTGVVLEGGAMRGLFTAGVLDIFLDHEIQVDGILGVSAGAVFGVNYLSKQRGRVLRYNKRFNQDKDYMGVRPLLRTGDIINREYAYERVPEQLDVFDWKTFRESGVPFYAGVTNLDTGKPDYFQVKDVAEQMDILRASASMPFVTKPVQIGNGRYLDGGVSDSVPYQKMFEMGYDRLILVLTRDGNYEKKPLPERLVRMAYRHYPGFRDDLLYRHEAYNRCMKEIRELEKTGRVFAIRPAVPVEVKKLERDPEKLQGVYDLGIAAATERMDALKRWLKEI